KIDLIVRGVCRLIPGVEGMSENIRVHSVIGRSLEHSRIYYFNRRGEHKYFIGSADWMHRNLDARVEAITPIENEKLKKYLQFMLNIYFNDNKQRWLLQSDGSYERAKKEKGSSKLSAHDYLMKHMNEGNEPIPRAE
ncbi:MAG TPA: polyphosphate kinase 1, partial [Balneolaceae bacterium]|nr:polyphosphate kinase 1 [Balneolaceae bacterium]